MFNVVGSTEWGADLKVMLHLITSLVRSKLDYACMVYGSARKSYLQMPDLIHNHTTIALGLLRACTLIYTNLVWMLE